MQERSIPADLLARKRFDLPLDLDHEVLIGMLEISDQSDRLDKLDGRYRGMTPDAWQHALVVDAKRKQSEAIEQIRKLERQIADLEWQVRVECNDLAAYRTRRKRLPPRIDREWYAAESKREADAEQRKRDATAESRKRYDDRRKADRVKAKIKSAQRDPLIPMFDMFVQTGQAHAEFARWASDKGFTLDSFYEFAKTPGILKNPGQWEGRLKAIRS